MMCAQAPFTRKILHSLLAAGMLFILAACAAPPDEQAQPTASPRGSATPIPTLTPAASPSPSPTPYPDLNGETFTLYVIASNDEPFTETAAVVRASLDDYTAYTNTHGGINGAQLNLVYADVDASGAGALSAFELFSTHQDALVVLMLAPVSQQLYEEIDEQEVPVIYLGLGALPLDFAENDHLFWVVPPPEQQLAVWVDYALKNWPDLRPEGQRDVMRLNYIGWNGTQTSFRALPGIPEYFEQQNIILANQGRLNPSDNASASNAILDGVYTQSTMIYLDLCAYGPAIVLNDLHYLALESFFATAGGSWSLGIDLTRYMPDPSGAPSLYTPLPIAVWGERDNPGIQRADAIFDFSERSAGEKELGYLYGLAAIDLAASAIQQAVTEGRSMRNLQLGPEDVFQALSEMEDFPVLDGLMEVGFADGSRSPTQLRIWRYDADESLTPISDWLPLVDLTP